MSGIKESVLESVQGSGPNLGSLNFESQGPTFRRLQSKSGSDSFMFSHKIFLLPAQGVRQ